MNKPLCLSAARWRKVLSLGLALVAALCLLAAEARAQCCSVVVTTNRTMVIEIDDCPLTLTYDVQICPVDVTTMVLKKVEWVNTGCCYDMWNSASFSISDLLSQISNYILNNNFDNVFPAGSGRVSKYACWKGNSNGENQYLEPCNTTVCCWLEGTVGSGTYSSGQSGTLPTTCTGTNFYDCQLICQ